jgi:hypothetical protein
MIKMQCNRRAALDGLFTQLFQPPQPKMALIGPGCSVAMDTIDEIFQYYDNISQVRPEYVDALIDGTINKTRG